MSITNDSPEYKSLVHEMARIYLLGYDETVQEVVASTIRHIGWNEEPVIMNVMICDVTDEASRLTS